MHQYKISMSSNSVPELKWEHASKGTRMTRRTEWLRTKTKETNVFQAGKKRAEIMKSLGPIKPRVARREQIEKKLFKILFLERNHLLKERKRKLFLAQQVLMPWTVFSQYIPCAGSSGATSWS